MTPAMTQPEVQLFSSFLRCSDRYLEFGSGGSTVLAANLVKRSIDSVDSSSEWLEKVYSYCDENNTPVKPRVHHVDIGPTKEWGNPKDESSIESWHLYHSQIWETTDVGLCDLLLVDGRFRVACFLQTLAHAHPSAIILIHDFKLRTNYHVARDFGHEIASSDTLSAFQRRSDYNPAHAAEILKRHWRDVG